MLGDDRRRFRLIGDGQERPAAERLAKELQLDNVDFVDAVSETELAGEIARASICLGVFGTTDKAQRVVANKVFQCAAAGRAVITADTPAIRTAFGDALVTVPVGDAAALADAVRGLRGDERVRTASAPGRPSSSTSPRPRWLAILDADALPRRATHAAGAASPDAVERPRAIAGDDRDRGDARKLTHTTRSMTPSTTPCDSGRLMIGLNSAMSASRAPRPAGKKPIATDIAPASRERQYLGRSRRHPDRLRE